MIFNCHFSSFAFVARVGLVLSLLTGAGAAAADSDLIDTKANYAVIMDAETGEVLFEKNGDERMAPASMSKLMTVAVVFDALRNGVYTPDDTFTVSQKAWKKGGSKMWVLVGDKIRIRDLLRGIIIQSGNDACIVIAEGMAGTEEAFARRMTDFGKEIGLTNSTFANATGWPDPEHRMTARDLAALARYLITEYPQLYPIFSEKEFEWSDITQPNRNPLIYLDIGADGLKTGHTEESGYGLVGSAMRGDRRLIVVLNGLESERERASEGARMMNIGFREFRKLDLFEADQQVGEAQVWMGQEHKVGVVVKDPVAVSMHRRARKDMEVKLSYTGPIQAPVAEGDEVGTLEITAPGMTPRSFPVYAAHDVSRVGLIGRIWEALLYKFYGLPQG